jgi:hypothetical protein
VLLLGYQDNANCPLPWVGYGDRKWDEGRKEGRKEGDKGTKRIEAG